MTNSKHTPGPWELSEIGDYADFDGHSRILLGDDMRIAAIHTNGEPENEANGRLIAAAPELLAALESLLLFDREERPSFRLKPMGSPGSAARIREDKLIALEDAAMAAIAKAKGGAK